MFIASKNSAEFKAPWPEKNLFSTEYGGNQVHTGTKMLQRRYVVPPKFIFYKNSHPRLYRVHKVFYIGRPVKRQIQDGICHRIIFAHFISRRRKKRQQDFGLRVFASKTFHERTPLLKLPKRSGMHPQVITIGSYTPAFFANTAHRGLLSIKHGRDFI